MFGKGGVKFVQLFHKIPRSKRVKMKNVLLKCIYKKKKKKGLTNAGFKKGNI